jgi:ABC-type antimicrobial peptide transport system permease subunit
MKKIVEDKQEYYNNCLYRENQPYALIKLSANLQEIQIIIDAMKAIVAFVIVMLLIIIVTGVSSTFRVIAMKRINEIGIYKAIGMKRLRIYGMLLTETLLLLVAGCIAGFIFSCLLSSLIGLINFSFIPAFDIFLINGKMKGIISIKYFIIIFVAIVVTTTLAVMFAVKKSVSVTPCQALAVTE